MEGLVVHTVRKAATSAPLPVERRREYSQRAELSSSLNVFCAEVCVVTHILVLDLTLNCKLGRNFTFILY